MKYENKKIVYEVWDWVTVTDNVGSSEYTEGETGQVSFVDTGGSNLFLRLGDHGSVMFDYRFRLATQEEIDKATESEDIMVGDYKVDFGNARGDQLDFIKIGCVRVTKELYLKIGKKAGWM